jgi:hypothetical protein
MMGRLDDMTDDATRQVQAGQTRGGGTGVRSISRLIMVELLTRDSASDGECPSKWEHVAGAKYCEHLFDHYIDPQG